MVMIIKNTKIVVPLKYLSNIFRSLEMPLIDCKNHLELNWNNNYVMFGVDIMMVVIMLITEKQHFK